MHQKIILLEQTLWACPCQWEATLDDGRMIYVRYRWGYLTANVSKTPTTDIKEAVVGPTILRIQLGDEYDGEIDWEDVLPLLSIIYLR